MNKYEFDTEMKTGDMFAFMLRQCYGGFRGIAFVFIDFALILSLVWNWSSMQLSTKLIMIIITFVLVVVEPLQLLAKAKAQVKFSERFQNKTHYAVDAEGITVSQGVQSMELKWGHLFKYVNSGKRLYVYTSRASAFVFPKADIPSDAMRFLIEKLTEHKGEFLTLSLDTIKIVDEETAGEAEKNSSE